MLRPVRKSVLASTGLLLAVLASFPVGAGSTSLDGHDGKMERASAGEFQVADNRHRGGYDDHDRHGHFGGYWSHDHDRHHYDSPLIVIRPAPRIVYYRDSYVYPRPFYEVDPPAVYPGALSVVVVGGLIGSTMDRTDHAQAAYILETGRTGFRSEWRNPYTGYGYAILPTRTYQAFDGQYCREYTTWGWIGGREQQLYGQACRMPDGNWRVAG